MTEGYNFMLICINSVQDCIESSSKDFFSSLFASSVTFATLVDDNEMLCSVIYLQS